jgi:hypothetical protein
MRSEIQQVHEGGCLCKAVRYKVKAAPLVGTVCHCRFCQTRTGSAFAAMGYFREEDVEIRGRLTAYEHRSDESGRALRIEFCPICGTPVTHTAELRPGLRGIGAGTFDQPGWFRHDRHVWTRSKHAWVAVPEDVDAYPQGSTNTVAPRP